MENNFSTALAEMSDPIRIFRVLAKTAQQIRTTKAATPMDSDDLKWLREVQAAGNAALEQITALIDERDANRIRRDVLVLKNKRRQREAAK